jgi:hypothetical protein
VRGLERIGRLDGEVEQERIGSGAPLMRLRSVCPSSSSMTRNGRSPPPDVVERADVRVVQRRGRPGLTLEPLSAAGSAESFADRI